MQHVGERVPIGDMLRIFGGVDVPPPDAKAGGRNEGLTQQDEHDGLEGQQ